ncbi:hypothetical protein PFAG_01854 [Plasmodium falciparum Santa Lucia]|uniref:EMP1-trafficking protein n=1 Tax=Plasmodium falciparum Santa Lucia TaxID=478859 RepID=W7G0W8_PLAFA|nr:hypothetical protein PFAG_01854 [Plasmodium falciparum Santa Lucia]
MLYSRLDIKKHNENTKNMSKCYTIVSDELISREYNIKKNRMWYYIFVKILFLSFFICILNGSSYDTYCKEGNKEDNVEGLFSIRPSRSLTERKQRNNGKPSVYVNNGEEEYYEEVYSEEEHSPDEYADGEYYDDDGNYEEVNYDEEYYEEEGEKSKNVLEKYNDYASKSHGMSSVLKSVISGFTETCNDVKEAVKPNIDTIKDTLSSGITNIDKRVVGNVSSIINKITNADEEDSEECDQYDEYDQYDENMNDQMFDEMEYEENHNTPSSPNLKKRASNYMHKNPNKVNTKTVNKQNKFSNTGKKFESYPRRKFVSELKSNTYSYMNKNPYSHKKYVGVLKNNSDGGINKDFGTKGSVINEIKDNNMNNENMQLGTTKNVLSEGTYNNESDMNKKPSTSTNINSENKQNAHTRSMSVANTKSHVQQNVKTFSSNHYENENNHKMHNVNEKEEVPKIDRTKINTQFMNSERNHIEKTNNSYI